VHTSAGIPRLNDLSPATSTEKEDKGFEFKCNTNLHASLEQKPSLRKEIVYSGPANGITKKIESGNKTVLNLASESDRCLNSNQTDNILSQPKRLDETKMNLGCSIENDQITITPERRLSEIVKRNNLSRSLSATFMKEPRKEAVEHSFGPSLNPASLMSLESDLSKQKLGSFTPSLSFDSLCDKTRNSLPLTPRCSLKSENTDKKEESLLFSTFSQNSSQTNNTSRAPNRAEKLKMLLEKAKKQS